MSDEPESSADRCTEWGSPAWIHTNERTAEFHAGSLFGCPACFPTPTSRSLDNEHTAKGRQE